MSLTKGTYKEEIRTRQTSQPVLNRQYFENDYTKDEKKDSQVESTERQEMYECKNYIIRSDGKQITVVHTLRREVFKRQKKMEREVVDCIQLYQDIVQRVQTIEV